MTTVPTYIPTSALVTTAMAAEETAVVPDTIRKWVQLKHLAPAGRRGRSHLFRLEDVFAAERATRRAHERRPSAARGREPSPYIGRASV